MGLSLGKLLVLGVIVLAVWYGFKYRSRIEAVRAALQRERDARRQRPPAPGPTIAVEDTGEMRPLRRLCRGARHLVVRPRRLSVGRLSGGTAAFLASPLASTYGAAQHQF